jgi:hypothetical protein
MKIHERVMWLAASCLVLANAAYPATKTPKATAAMKTEAARQLLRERIEFWESDGKAMRCVRPADRDPPAKDWPPFPSKECSNNGAGTCKDLDLPDKCDDADTVFFSGLLCMSGDPVGCAAVREAQGSNGRWWRSARQKVLRPAEADSFPESLSEAVIRYQEAYRRLEKEAKAKKKPAPDGDAISKEAFSKGSTTFSSDAANGVYAYLIMEGRNPTTNAINPQTQKAFHEWVKWIDRNGRCKTFCGVLGAVGAPRFCLSDRCHFKMVDCSMFLVIGEYLDVKVPFCHERIVIFDTTATYVSAMERLRSKKDNLIEKLSKLPASGPLRDQLEKQFTQIEKIGLATAKDVDAEYSKLEAPLRKLLALHNELLLLSAASNSDYHAKHNVVMLTLLLEKIAKSDMRLHQYAQYRWAKHKQNAFFGYAADRSPKNFQTLAGLITKQCPAPNEKSHRRTEWKWERDPKHGAWTNTHSMYWECIHAAKLLLNDTIPPNYNSTTVPQKLVAAILTSQEVLRRLVGFLDAVDQMMPHSVGPEVTLDQFARIVRNAGATDVRKLSKEIDRAIKGPPKILGDLRRRRGGGDYDLDDVIRPKPWGGKFP